MGRWGPEGGSRSFQEGWRGSKGGGSLQDASDNCERNAFTMDVEPGPRALAPPRNRSRRALEKVSNTHHTPQQINDFSSEISILRRNSAAAGTSQAYQCVQERKQNLCRSYGIDGNVCLHREGKVLETGLSKKLRRLDASKNRGLELACLENPVWDNGIPTNVTESQDCGSPLAVGGNKSYLFLKVIKSTYK